MGWVDFLFKVVDEESELYGEEFFVEVVKEDDYLAMAWDIAVENFPDVKLECLGSLPPDVAELIGYDTF